MVQTPENGGDVAVSGREVTRAVDREVAFRWWFNEGDRHTLREVADHFDVGERTVERWSADEDWMARAADIDRQAAAKAEADLVKAVARRTRLAHALTEQSAAQLLRNITAGNVTVTPGEALALLKHSHLLDGGATERTVEVSHEQDTNRHRIVEAVADELDGLTDDQVEAEVALLGDG